MSKVRHCRRWKKAQVKPPSKGYDFIRNWMELGGGGSRAFRRWLDSPEGTSYLRDLQPLLPAQQTLYRGINGVITADPRWGEPPAGVEPVGRRDLRVNAYIKGNYRELRSARGLQSWTTSRSVAEGYAKGRRGFPDYDFGVVITEEIPREQIIFHHRYVAGDYHLKSENKEVIVDFES